MKGYWVQREVVFKTFIPNASDSDEARAIEWEMDEDDLGYEETKIDVWEGDEEDDE
jgi:hypothetical protein